MEGVCLYRQDEKQWAFRKDDKEIRLITPGFRDRTADYALAKKVQTFLSSQPSIGKYQLLDWEKDPKEPASSGLLGRWQIKEITEKKFKEFQAESLVYTHDFNNLNVRYMAIQPNSYFRAAYLFLEKWIPWSQSPPPLSKKMVIPFEGDIVLKFFQHGVFHDPFSRLSLRALQRYETPFISEFKPAGSYHFTLENGLLMLRHNSRISNSTGTAAAVRAYRDFIRRAFEWRLIENTQEGLEADLKSYPEAFNTKMRRSSEEQFLGYLRENYGIDFDRMIKEGTPLLPDHVYKCNIAANQIEIPYAESLYLRLDRCLKPACQHAENQSFDTTSQFYEFLKKKNIDLMFSLKEIEGIYQSFVRFSPDKSFSGLKKYLNSFSFLHGIQHDGFGGAIRCLSPKSFHRLTEILYVGWNALSDMKMCCEEKFFTGRKITHISICGYKTMGDRTTYDPCRNLAEFLHVFPRLQKGNMISYHELLAHVVSKKSLHQRYPAKDWPGEIEWRVGRLVPFPDDAGISRWYYIDGYLDDKAGDVNYVLIPACRGYLETGCADDNASVLYEKRAPLIKLYRSTAMDPEAESSIESLLADLNPSRVGSLDFDRGEEHEMPYFQRCTMPLWVAYLVVGNVERAAESFLEAIGSQNRVDKEANGKEENLIRFLTWQRKGNSRGVAGIFKKFKEQVGAETLRTFFASTSLGSEWAKQNKIAQDIHFVGHSLGAALSQNALYHFGPRAGRVPLVGCNFKCMAFDPPGGVTSEEGVQFLEFGRKHKELLVGIGQKWGVHYYFEYQDFVPQGGPEWIGVSAQYRLDKEWLDLQGTVFRPLPSAKHIDITTMPTHGRRFLLITTEEAKHEYQATPLTPNELYEFKTAYWLPLELRSKFGFHVTTPRMTEELRRTVGGTFIFSILWLKKQWDDFTRPKDEGTQDASGVRFYSVNRPDHSVEETSGP